MKGATKEPRKHFVSRPPMNGPLVKLVNEIKRLLEEREERLKRTDAQDQTA
jgi:hypothetical protein